MTIAPQDIPAMVYKSLMEPAAVAKDLIALRWDRATLWMALALVAVLNVLLLALVQVISPLPDSLVQQGISMTPFSYAIVVGVFLTLLIFTSRGFGKMLGGVGELQDMLVIVVWFQVMSVALEAVQVVLLIFSAGLASLFGLASLGVLIWCMINFLDVAHGFGNKAKAIGTLVLAVLATAMGSGLVLAVVQGMMGRAVV